MFGEKIKEVVVTQGQVNNKKVWSQGSWLISMMKFRGVVKRGAELRGTLVRSLAAS